MRSIEDEHTEFKLLNPNGSLPATFIKTIIAFLNTDGGSIFLGVNDNGEPEGIQNVDSALNKVSSSIKDNIVPEALTFINVEPIKLKSKDIIKVVVAKGINRPYYLKSKGLKPGGVFIRKGASTLPADDATIREMIALSTGRSFEKQISLEQELTFNSLKQEMSKQQITFTDSNMHTLGIKNTGDQYTNLALILSDQCPFSIKIAVFEDEDGIIFHDRRNIKGSLIQQLNEAIEFIELNNNVHADIDKLQRQDKKDYPTQAIREALLNCIVHRDYSFSASSIVNIYKSSIEFISIGSLVSGISLEAAMNGVSQSRNPLLASLFYRLGLVESYGTGIRKIFNLFKGYKPPEFSTHQGGFFVKMFSKNGLWNLNKDDDNSRVLQHGKTFSVHKEQNSESAEGDNTSNEPDNTISDELRILREASKNSGITRKAVQDLLGVGQTTAFELLKVMCDKEELVKVGQSRNTKYVVKREI